MADARRLLELSMVPILAKEVAAQITAGVGDKRRLLELTMPPRLASEVANQITTATADKRRLVELGMVPRLALELATQITGGGVINPPYPAPDGYVWDFVADNDNTLLADSDGELFINLFRVSA